MSVTFYYICLLFLIAGCRNTGYTVRETGNPVYRPNVAFQTFEDLHHPGFQNLKDKYQLDTIFHGETDEFKRILLLRHWIKQVIKINDHGDPYPGEGFAEGILDAALRGQGFHCGHFMTVQNAIMNAYGYFTRTLGAGPGVEGGPDGHHGINEIWLNDYHKWFLSDAKYDQHFEKNGTPLSALEVRAAYLKNEAADIVTVKGPNRTIIDFDHEVERSKERFAQTYTWITWHGNGDYFTSWPDHTGKVVMYQDDFYNQNIWFRDGKPCWIYAHEEVLNLVSDKNAIEWTPNTMATEVEIKGNRATIKLISHTPNLKEYLVKEEPSGEWKSVDEIFKIELEKNKYELTFQTANLANIKGPPHQVVIEAN